MPIEIERLMNRLANSHGQRRGIGWLIEQFLNDGEFVAAQTGNHVEIPDAVAQPIGHTNEQVAAGRMSEGVIALLQVINVEIQYCKPLSTPDTFEFLLKLLAKHLAIGQAGQLI